MQSHDAHTILTAAAVLLLAFGAPSLVRRRRPSALALLLWPLILGERGPAALPPGVTIVDKSQSLLGLVEVILDENRGVRFLRSDHSLLGAQFVADGSSAFGFVNVLEAIRFFRPEAKTVLAIGLGTGEAPHALGRHGLTVDVVEIDPAVVRFARSYFGFSPTGQVHVDDARSFRDSPPDSTKPLGNTIFFASDGPLDFRIPEGTRFENEISEQLQRGFITWPALQGVPDGPLITDARNPLARLQIPVAEQHFTAMNKLLPLEVWLN